MTQQNYYKRRKKRQQRSVDGQLVADLVGQERQKQPRLGTRKLHYLIKPELAKARVRIGRDRLFEELRKRDLLVKPRPSLYPRTTQAYHSLPIFRNLIKDRQVKRPNETWVSDITYLRTQEGFLYLALITDRYSRKIVGWHLGDSLESIGCQRALEQALRDLPKEHKPIHHSDRGCQYCCHEYVQQLMKRGLPISMTESDHCAENALAERMNGILKQEYGLGEEFPSKRAARVAVSQGVEMYNTRRPHSALGYQVPEWVHRQGLN